MTSSTRRDIGGKVLELAKSKQIEQAYQELELGLKVLPNDFYLLCIGSDISRTKGNHSISLKYASLLISSHPQQWDGYGRAAGDLHALKRFNEADSIIKKGLEKFPDNFFLLCIASKIQRGLDYRIKSLDYAKQLIKTHPSVCDGYAIAIEDLLQLKRIDEAKQLIESGLKNFPEERRLIVLAINANRATGQLQNALSQSRHLISLHPEEVIGYLNTAEDLLTLKKINKANIFITESCHLFPNSVSLLILKGEALLKGKRFKKAAAAFKEGFDQCEEKFQAQRAKLLRNRAYAQTLAGLSLEDNKDHSSIYDLSERSLVTFSDQRDYFESIQKCRRVTPILSQPENSICKKRYLFVSGLWRSGTTALGSLLNISSKVELYHELHNGLRINGYDSTDFSENEINQRLKTHPFSKEQYKIFQEKHFHSKYIGDKRPLSQFSIESTFKNLTPQSQVRVIYIYRNLFEVCLSAEARSTNQQDLSWDAEKGIEHTICMHNACCRQIIHLKKNHPNIFNAIHFVHYDDVLSNPISAQKIFKGLEIELSNNEHHRIEMFALKAAEFKIMKKSAAQKSNNRIQDLAKQLLDRVAHDQFCHLTSMKDHYLT